MQAVAALFTAVREGIQAGDWETVADRVAEYAASGAFNAHVGGALAEQLITHEPLFGTAAALLDRCVAANSLENLAMLGPDNASQLKLGLDFGSFHSLQALLLLKRGQLEPADSAMALALSHLAQVEVDPQAADLLRAGLIDWRRGDHERGWERIGAAILLDTSVEQQDPFYLEALEGVVEARSGWGPTVAGYLAAYRRDEVQPAPDLALQRLDGERFWLSAKRGRGLLVSFFSPVCGTCRQEIPALRDLHEAAARDDDIEVLFILNNPRLVDGVAPLFESAGIDSPQVATLAEGNAFDHIVGEPTVWIIDTDGRLRARHTGYRPGDEAMYARELAEASVPPRACDCGKK